MFEKAKLKYNKKVYEQSVSRAYTKLALEKLCRDNLPDSHVPDEYVYIDRLPITRAGKIDYRALEKQAEEMSKE